MVAFGIIFACVALAVLLLALYTFMICFYAPKKRCEDPYSLIKGKQYEEVKEHIVACTGIMERTQCQRVNIRSHDGLKLSGRYYHTADGAPLLLMMHGYRSMALRDDAGGFMLGKKLGFNVLAVDQRGHGKSEGRVITFGIKERLDCLRWINHAIDRFGSQTKIVLSGLSMGAATVLMTSDLELPENVVGIMADCPYSSPAGIIKKVCRDRHIPDKLAYPFIRLGAQIYGGFDLESDCATESVKHANIPIMLVHGTDDRFVPYPMSKKIFEACKDNARLHLFENAGHGLCYMVDPVRYETVTVEFLRSIPQLKAHFDKNSYAQKVLRHEL